MSNIVYLGCDCYSFKSVTVICQPFPAKGYQQGRVMDNRKLRCTRRKTVKVSNSPTTLLTRNCFASRT
ncbi:hypothetical protein EUGRSUZ_B03526 [Eucalyptus grandis]|uniref:Uncharacterized protein n=2 Tax=Eucalyptus grandis TaxID=71139 RepID=A0ACC3LXF1_EUCGR|nr:hypothetical protein EUGRSUZ_B03526 [Eucalyptus grandis]